MANTGVMQSLHKNENLLFKDFQDFLVQSQHLFEKRIPFHFRWINIFNDSCPRQHLDDMGKRMIPYISEDLPSKSAAGRQRENSLSTGRSQRGPVEESLPPRKLAEWSGSIQ